MTQYEVDTVVVGAGVIGLACAKALAEAGRDVLILEAQSAFGQVTSARNSEVIHSGLYYAPGSLKAALCVRGRQLLYDYCASRNVAHRRCGKLVVATTQGEIDDLEKLQATARANGVDDTSLLTAAQARTLEPALDAVAALLCPSTGIVDSHAYMLALLGDAQAYGAQLICHSPVESGQVCAEGGLALGMAGPEPVTVRAATVVNAAGLKAPELARRMVGVPAGCVPQPVFCKGNYFTLTGKSPFSRLIYPMPEVGGLGVHLTLDLNDQVRFGPDTEWLATTDANALDYRVDARRGDGFYSSIRKYWPRLQDGALEPGYSGVRPKVRVGDGGIFPDFIISGPADHGVAGLVNLFGIESPGLTASLAIGQVVAGLL